MLSWDMKPADSCKNRRENITYYIVVLYGRLTITFDVATACQLYLQGKRGTRQWRYRCKRLSSPSIMRYESGDSVSSS
jgi:hypothetical protein